MSNPAAVLGAVVLGAAALVFCSSDDETEPPAPEPEPIPSQNYDGPHSRNDSAGGGRTHARPRVTLIS